jgi:hypothetical protein
VGDFNKPLSPVVRPSRCKPNKETSELNDTIDPMNLIDIDRIF